MKKSTLIFLTILSSILAVFGYFHIPILGALGIDLFPNRSPLYLLFLFPVVILCNVPLVLCIIALTRLKKKNAKETKEENK